MGKLYNRGDVVFLKNQQIYVEGRGYALDLRVNGHPYIIMRDVDDLGEEVPCLLMSSKPIHTKNMFDTKINLEGREHLKSYIDVGRVYNIIFDKRYITRGYIKDFILEQIEKSLIVKI